MRQVGIIAAGALFALENNLDRIKEDHRRAKMLASMLSECDLFEITSEDIQTNIVILNLPDSIKVDKYIEKLANNGLLIVPFGAASVRAVAHLNVDDEDISSAAEILIKTAKSY